MANWKDVEDLDPAADHVTQRGHREHEHSGGYTIDPATIHGGTGQQPKNPDGTDRK